MNRIIFHIDANSAFLSWTAADRVKKGLRPDLREIPAVIGGDERSRKGVVLAKSIPAKNYGIHTGETLFSARCKCPSLTVVPPNFSLYKDFSEKMFRICNRFSPELQKFSIDELFLDYTNMEMHFGPPEEGAAKLKECIKKELGFTVNIGISNNKLLAKMASDFEKPDKIHTLFSREIQEKMWPLPVSSLFMIGRKTAEKLRRKGISTIGQLAACDLSYLEKHLKSHGKLIWYYANGIDCSFVQNAEETPVKSLGNGTTFPSDITTYEQAERLLLALTEKVSSRLREKSYAAGLVELSLKTTDFSVFSRRRKLLSPLRATNDLYFISREILHEMWQQQPLRAMSLRLGNLSPDGASQCSFLDMPGSLKHEALDHSIDTLRTHYGYHCITRASLLKGSFYQRLKEDHIPPMNAQL